MDGTILEPAGRPDPLGYLVAGFLLALVLVLGALAVLMGPMMGMGGMMGSGTQGGAGIWSWGVAAILLGLAASAVVLVMRRYLPAREGAPPARVQASLAPAVPPPARAPAAGAQAMQAPDPDAAANALEVMALRLLDRDERLLFIEVRDKGGAALQKDLGHRDGFSRSKVTRTLDRLEAKGLIARERNGMTNRVRLLTRPGSPPST